MRHQIRQLIIEPEAKQALKERYNETNNRRWQERIQCVLLKNQGLTLEAISDVLPYNINTISYWIREYAEKGLEGICVWEYQGSSSHLSAELQSELKNKVVQMRYSRVADVVAWVETQWQISYSDDGMREMLHNLGFSYQKGRIIPGKADSEAQALFLKETFEDMKASLNEQDQYYFVDGVHPTYNPVLGYSWSLQGQRAWVLSNTAR